MYPKEIVQDFKYESYTVIYNQQKEVKIFSNRVNILKEIYEKYKKNQKTAFGISICGVMSSKKEIFVYELKHVKLEENDHNENLFLSYLFRKKEKERTVLVYTNVNMDKAPSLDVVTKRLASHLNCNVDDLSCSSRERQGTAFLKEEEYVYVQNY